MVRRLVLPLVPTAAAIAVVMVCLTYFGAYPGLEKGAGGLEWLSRSAVLLVGLAFCCEYVDSTLGMGYGTTLTPLLITIFGFSKTLEVVPAVLFSELFTGIVAGISHHNAGNVSLRPGSKHFKVSAVLAVCSIVGTLLAVVIALSIPRFWLNMYIGVLVLAMGLLILVFRNHRRRFSWRKIVGLGCVASFNKGMSGGGYGPLVTAGQILSGVEEKSSVGITSFAEGLTCVVGIIAYSVLQKGAMAWHLAGPLAVGALLSVPFSAWSVKKISTKKLTLAIGILTTLLGLFTLYKVIFR